MAILGLVINNSWLGKRAGLSVVGCPYRWDWVGPSTTWLIDSAADAHKMLCAKMTLFKVSGSFKRDSNWAEQSRSCKNWCSVISPYRLEPVPLGGSAWPITHELWSFGYGAKIHVDWLYLTMLVIACSTTLLFSREQSAFWIRPCWFFNPICGNKLTWGENLRDNTCLIVWKDKRHKMWIESCRLVALVF